MATRSLFYGLVGVCAILTGALAGAVGATGARADGSLGPNTTCTSPSPCLTEANNGTGPGLASSSKGGNGLTSSTKLSNTSSSFAAGVQGTDSSSSGKYNSGVQGTSTNGTGVTGTSKNGSGVIATSSGGTGLTATGASALFGKATGGTGTGLAVVSPYIGVQAYSTGTTGTAVIAYGSGGPLFDGETNFTKVFGVDKYGNVTVAGGLDGLVVGAQNAIFSNTIGGLAAVNASAPDEGVLGRATSPSASFGAVTASGSGGSIFEGYNSANARVLKLDDSGNLTINGLIYTAGGCSTGCIVHGNSQRRIVSYAPRESQPTMEDFGEAQLVNGEAYIALEPSFVNVIDRSANYLVFVTPEGDCNGLFIAGKSQLGFTVRELRGGKSSLAFEYRIVARPFGEAAARLPMVALRVAPSIRAGGHTTIQRP